MSRPDPKNIKYLWEKNAIKQSHSDFITRANSPFSVKFISKNYLNNLTGSIEIKNNEIFNIQILYPINRPNILLDLMRYSIMHMIYVEKSKDIFISTFLHDLLYFKEIFGFEVIYWKDKLIKQRLKTKTLKSHLKEVDEVLGKNKFLENWFFNDLILKNYLTVSNSIFLKKVIKLPIYPDEGSAF